MYIYSLTSRYSTFFMRKICFRLIFLLTISTMAVSCASTKKATQSTESTGSLKYLNTYIIPFNLQFKNTTVGGLSGIDYDAANNLYYLICDDRSEKNPARFYTAQIFLSAKGVDSLAFIDVKSMLQANGETYPSSRENKYGTVDPEAMRYNPKTNQLIWSSEGERAVKQKDTILTNPAVLMSNSDGKYIDSFVLPQNMHMSALKKGPRKNGTFEGMTFADDYKSLFISVEEPLYEDGPQADVVDNNAYIRIIKFDVASKKAKAQFAYKLDPVAYPSNPASEFKINGVSDILSLDNNKLLVIERSFSTGRLPCTVKLFVADIAGATDIANVVLEGNENFTAIKKTLLLNMDDLGIYTDNIEGVTFGPVLPNGNRTLIFIADNNFNAFEKAQVLLFEVLK